MPQGPPEPPPESIVLNQFSGMKNVVNPERLAPGELEVAVNVDLDDVGQLRRRRGYTRRADGNYHSFFRSTRGVFCVKDGNLGRLYQNYSFSSLGVFAAQDPVAFVEVGPDIYFSTVDVSGVIRADETVDPWGAADETNQWVSPVLSPVATLGAVSGRLLGKPPRATTLSYYNGRIYLGFERVLWVTELYDYHHVDKTRNFMYFENDITMSGVATDGVYVGTTDQLFFLRGAKYPLKREPVIDAGVIPGSMVTVPADLLHPQARQGPMPGGSSLMFLTTAGLCAAFDGGQVYNLTQTQVLFPEAQTVAALFRQQDGINQYVGVADSGGTPSANARIGDYVDAEIRRFQG